MLAEVKSAAKATEIAATFLKQYYGFLRPISADKTNGTWLVKVDVGLYNKKIIKVVVDASTAEVVNYTPEREG